MMRVHLAMLLVVIGASPLRAQDIRLVERTTSPLMKADRPWEDYCIGYTQVIRDAGVWHMWYASYDHNYRDDSDGLLCYARSTDGITWEKPNLGLVEYDGSRENNILIRRGVHGHCVFIDETAKPAERFKMVFSGLVGSEWLVFGATSPDGLTWTRIEKPLLAKNSDTQNVCFRDGEVYRLYVRMWTGANFSGKRVVGYSESRTFGGFPDPKVILAPDDKDPPDVHFYNPAVAKLRGGLYAMFPSAFHTSDDSVRPHVAIGRDGREFQRVGRTPFLPVSTGFDAKSIYVAPGAIPADKPGEYWLYYVGSDLGHDAGTKDKAKYAGGIGRFRIAVGNQ